MSTKISPTPRRPRGAPYGNTNAVKHGFYAHSFTGQEKHLLAAGIKGELKDEEELLRTFINRTIQAMNDSPLPSEETEAMVIALRAISLAVGRIESIHRSRRIIFDQATTFDKAMEELKYLPIEED